MVASLSGVLFSVLCVCVCGINITLSRHHKQIDCGYSYI